jgi:hypothetical protein
MSPGQLKLEAAREARENAKHAQLLTTANRRAALQDAVAAREKAKADARKAAAEAADAVVRAKLVVAAKVEARKQWERKKMLRQPAREQRRVVEGSGQWLLKGDAAVAAAKAVKAAGRASSSSSSNRAPGIGSLLRREQVCWELHVIMCLCVLCV